MKKSLLIFTLISFGFLFSYSAQEKLPAPDKTLTKIFDLVSAGKSADAVSLICLKVKKDDKFVYLPVDIKDKKQLRSAKKILRRISQYLKISDSHTIVSSEKEKGLTRIKVTFRSKGKSLDIIFDMAEINGKFYLNDID